MSDLSKYNHISEDGTKLVAEKYDGNFTEAHLACFWCYYVDEAVSGDCTQIRRCKNDSIFFVKESEQ